MWEGIIVDRLSIAGTWEKAIPASLQPIGSREEVLERLKKTFGSTKKLDTNLVLVRGGDFDIHFDIGSGDPVKSVKVSTNGEIYLVLELLNEKYGWMVFDLQVNDYLDFSREKPVKEGKTIEETEDIIFPEARVHPARAAFIFGRYFFLIAALLVLDMTVRPLLGDSLVKGTASTFISLITLFILYRFGRHNEFVRSSHALTMSAAVSLMLICLNMAKNWHIALKIEDPEIVKALTFAFILKALIYFVAIFLGVKIRHSRKGEQNLQFVWR